MDWWMICDFTSFATVYQSYQDVLSRQVMNNDMISSADIVSIIRRIERLCAVEPCLRLKRPLPQVGLELETTRSVGQCLTCWAAGAPLTLRRSWWMVDLRVYILFNSISVIWGQLPFYSERPCAMEPCLPLKRFPSQAGLEPGTVRSAGQHLTYWATGAPRWCCVDRMLRLKVSLCKDTRLVCKKFSCSNDCLCKQGWLHYVWK